MPQVLTLAEVLHDIALLREEMKRRYPLRRIGTAEEVFPEEEEEEEEGTEVEQPKKMGFPISFERHQEGQ